MKKHFAVFYSPGTLFAEQSCREVTEPFIRNAAKIARTIKERHSATPYGFVIEERICADPITVDGEELEVEQKMLSRTGTYFLGGQIKRFDEIPESILKSNMRSNDWPIVIENCNSWKTTRPFGEGDFVINGEGDILLRGDEAYLVEYRRKMIATWNQYSGDGMGQLTSHMGIK